ncbi:MAG: type IX secretion system PorP/SprF family membrane protein [Flavobacteriales bacterium]|jgi:type IX secretion system PorP/SprF family membrane protein
MKYVLQTLIFSVIGTLFLSQNLAQDVEFSQFYTTRNYLNPAFTALSNDQTITSTYRNQWPGIKNAYDSYFVSFDRKLKDRNAGFGLYYLGDIAGEGALQKQSFAFQYAKHIRFSKNIYGSLGLKGSYNSMSIHWDRLIWGDMLDARKGVVNNTNQQQGASKEQYFDSGTGFIIHSENLYGGVALEHLNRPVQGLLSLTETERISVRYKVHLGGNIPIQTVPNAPLVYISPQLIHTKQGNSSQTTIGSYISYNEFSVGVWHRLKDSFVVLLGVTKDDFRFGYSYDIGSNDLMSHSGGAHEVSITYSLDFIHRSKTEKYRVISCPTF